MTTGALIEGRRSSPTPLHLGRHVIAFLVLASPGIALLGAAVAAWAWPFPGSVAVAVLAAAIGVCVVAVAAMFGLGQLAVGPPLLRSFRYVDGVLFYRLGPDDTEPTVVRLSDLFRVDDVSASDFGVPGYVIVGKDRTHLLVSRDTENAELLAAALRRDLAAVPEDGTAIEGVMPPWPTFAPLMTLAAYAALILAVIGPVVGVVVALIGFGARVLGPTLALILGLVLIVLFNITLAAVVRFVTGHRGQWTASFLYAGRRLYYRLIEGPRACRSVDDLEDIESRSGGHVLRFRDGGCISLHDRMANAGRLLAELRRELVMRPAAMGDGEGRPAAARG